MGAVDDRHKSEVGAKPLDGAKVLDEEEKSILRRLSFRDPNGIVTTKEEAFHELWEAAMRAWKDTGLMPDENFEPVVFYVKDKKVWHMMMKVVPSKILNTHRDPNHMTKNWERLEDAFARRLTERSDDRHTESPDGVL